MVPRRDAIEMDMSVDDAIKMVISLGVVVPPWRGQIGGEPAQRDSSES